MGTFRKEYTPRSSLVAVCRTPVSLFAMVIEAFAITAPVESLTVPEILPPTPAEVTKVRHAVKVRGQKNAKTLNCFL
jgi:hypothetical protein